MGYAYRSKKKEREKDTKCTKINVCFLWDTEFINL